MPQIEERKGIGRTVAIVLLVVFTVIYLFPLFYVVNTSFRPWAQIKEYPPKLMFEPSIGSYIRIFTARTGFPPNDQPTQAEVEEMEWYERIVYKGTNEQIVRMGDLPKRYMNSLVIVLLSTGITIILGTLAAYGFSRFKVKGKDDWLFFILSTRMIPPVVVVIPVFLLYRNIGLNDTHIGLILLYTAFNVSFAVWVMKGFLDEIPIEYEEAAMVDGYSRFEAFRKIVLPQAVTGIAATAVFCFIFAWNEYAFAFLLTRNTAQTVPAWLPYQMGVLGYDWGAAAAGSVLFLIPAMVFTILLRKHLVRGISFGAVRK
ncbi:MAG: carbohydrate ABC transporter permease [Spirochaetales bacterium]|nr:carbohydrate ABC transporter permease [Spirochaetales bacterium]MCF7937962.1 carbohydrate ABC transporter permease [Spirochaetales bacterium]